MIDFQVIDDIKGEIDTLYDEVLGTKDCDMDSVEQDRQAIDDILNKWHAMLELSLAKDIMAILPQLAALKANAEKKDDKKSSKKKDKSNKEDDKITELLGQLMLSDISKKSEDPFNEETLKVLLGKIDSDLTEKAGFSDEITSLTLGELEKLRDENFHGSNDVKFMDLLSLISKKGD